MVSHAELIARAVSSRDEWATKRREVLRSTIDQMMPTLVDDLTFQRWTRGVGLEGAIDEVGRNVDTWVEWVREELRDAFARVVWEETR